MDLPTNTRFDYKPEEKMTACVCIVFTHWQLEYWKLEFTQTPIASGKGKREDLFVVGNILQKEVYVRTYNRDLAS